MLPPRRILGLAAAAMLGTLAVPAGPGRLPAQGVTTGAISGRVVDEEQQPVEAAQIQVINRATGYTSGTLSRGDGRYTVFGLETGGPYTVIARRIGYEQRQQDGLRISVGQNIVVNFQLTRQATRLGEVEVTASEDPVFSPAKQGTGSIVSDSALRRLPTLNRNFTDFVATVPQVSTAGPGNSGGGVNNRFNQVQIDGATETDIFGLGSTGQPGGQARGKSISLEAVKEYQVLLSPFDVRQGNFAGFLVNAVTKSGTNDFHATGIFSTRNEGLARDVEFIRQSEFEQSQFGGSIGGPIIRDRIHFFLAPEFQRRTEPARGPFLGQSSSAAQPLPVSEAEIERFADILQEYGLTAGSAGRVDNENPLANVFGRLDVQITANHRLVLRHNYGKAEDEVFSRGTSVQGVPSFDLTTVKYRFKSEKHAPLAQLFSNFSNGANNELFIGYNRIRDVRDPDVVQPFIQVSVNAGGGFLRAGSEQFSQGNELDQDIFEITDNFTIPLGRHTITVGTKNEFYKLRNLFTESSYGVWTFRDLDSLEAGVPSTYRISTDLGGGVESNFRAAMHSVYAQDRWDVSDRLTVTAGLRLDMPTVSDKPRRSELVEEVFGRRTDEIPERAFQWSPRLGFNYNLGSNGVPSQLRGGVGLFVGRPPFVWISNTFTNSGANLGFLNCGGSSTIGPAPLFEPDPDNQPLECGNGVGIASGVVGPLNLIDDDLKFPQTLRATLAFDRMLPWWGLIATIEGLYTRGVNNLFYENLNLLGFQGEDRNGRVVYGDTIRTNAVAVPVLVDRRFSEAIDVTNQSKDYSFNITGQLEKRFSQAIEMRAAYTFQRARDVQSLGSSRAISNWRFGRTLSGHNEDAFVGISLFDQPHKISLSGTYTFPWQTWKTDISVIYTGSSGTVHDYVYGGTGGRGDLNADGVQGNDLIYVPRDATDPDEILFAPITRRVDDVVDTLFTAEEQGEALDRFIGRQDCLREQRGRILERNSCREPWRNLMNVSVRQSLPAVRGHTAAIQLDIFNFLNLLNRDWGDVWTVPGLNSNEPLLTHVGQTDGDLTESQGIFQFNPGTRRYDNTNLQSNYQIQLQLRYSF
jgi:hypothetical protein